MANKFRAIPTEVDGIRFASKREASVYGQLKLSQRAGEIENLECHPRFNMTINDKKIGSYTADFRFTDCETKKDRVIDVKSPITAKGEAFRLRKKVFEALYPDIELEIWT